MHSRTAFLTIGIAGLSLLLLLSGGARSAQAEQPESPVECFESAPQTELQYGDHTISCQIGSVADCDYFTFEGSIGECPRFTIESKASYMDPRFEIRDPDGIKLSENSCGGLCSFQVEPLDFTEVEWTCLEKSGTYTVIICDSGYDETGPYTLQLERIPPTSLPPLLANQSPVADSFDPKTDTDFFEYEGIAGTEVRFVVNGKADYADPRLEIWAPDGIKLTDTACGGLCSFQVEPADFTEVSWTSLEQSGTYLLAISDAGNDEVGSFELNAQCLVGPCDDPVSPVLSYGLPVDGSLSSPTDVSFYSFDGTTGASIRIVVNGKADYGDPRLEVWDPDGIKLTDTACGGLCSFDVEPADFTEVSWISLEKSGTYQIAVSDSNWDETARFQIATHCLIGNCDSDGDGIPNPHPKEIRYGRAQRRSLDSVTAMHFYDFEGTEGANIRIVVNGTADYMDPRLEIWDPDGSKLTDTACGGLCSFEVEPADFTEVAWTALEKSGTYRIAVSDSGWDENGQCEFNLLCLSSPEDCPYDPDPNRICTGGNSIGCGDNCVETPNSDQADAEADAIGDVCEICNDGIDNDEDGFTDLDDVGCYDENWNLENPQCQDGKDNDNDGQIDFDGGLSALGYVAAAPDAFCGDNPHQNRESRCGLGFELALILPALTYYRRWRRRKAS